MGSGGVGGDPVGIGKKWQVIWRSGASKLSVEFLKAGATRVGIQLGIQLGVPLLVPSVA